MSEEKSNDTLKFELELISTEDDINALQICMAGMEMSSERMRKATLNYLYDKYVTHAKTDYIKIR